MIRTLATAAALALSPLCAAAQSAAEIQPLLDTLRMSEVLDVMRAEGLAYGATIEDQMFPKQGGPAWAALVGRIYDTHAMDEVMASRLSTELSGADIGPMIDFYGTERGRQIVELEISARRALLDDSIEEDSLAALDEMRRRDDPRLDLIERFADANDLVESNVVGAMNANVAFYHGLQDGGAFPDGLSESDILSDVWAQEPDIRAETEDWVYSYLSLAYAPLSDDDLAAYIAFSESAPGRKLNAALFASFDTMFVQISHALGAGAAKFIVGEQL